MSVSKQSIAKFLSKEFHYLPNKCVISEVSKHVAMITCELDGSHLFSKESLMITADFALQFAILGKHKR